MRKYGRNIGALLLLLLFAWHWSNITLFPHAHVIDGYVYVHSHPFSGSAHNPTHSHSSQQLQLISYLSLLQMTVATLVALVLGLAGRTFVFRAPHLTLRQGTPIRIHGLRAPPLC